MTLLRCIDGSGLFRKGGKIKGGEMCWEPLFNATSADHCHCLPEFPSSTLIWMHLAFLFLAPSSAVMLQHMFVSSCCISSRADRACLEEKHFLLGCFVQSAHNICKASWDTSGQRCWVNRITSHGIAVPC